MAGKERCNQKTNKQEKGGKRVLFRPDRASRGCLDGPHTVQVVLIWSWVTRGQDATRRLILNGAPTLGWKFKKRKSKKKKKHIVELIYLTSKKLHPPTCSKHASHQFPVIVINYWHSSCMLQWDKLHRLVCKLNEEKQLSTLNMCIFASVKAICDLTLLPLKAHSLWPVFSETCKKKMVWLIKKRHIKVYFRYDFFKIIECNWVSQRCVYSCGIRR